MCAFAPPDRFILSTDVIHGTAVKHFSAAADTAGVQASPPCVKACCPPLTWRFPFLRKWILPTATAHKVLFMYKLFGRGCKRGNSNSTTGWRAVNDARIAG